MLWLALHFPRLGLEIWRLSGAAEEEARPTVLLEDNRVILCDEAAEQAGLQPGATLATAHSITADLVHFHRDKERETKRLALLGDLLYRFSGQVSLAPPDALVLEIGSSLALFDDAERLTREAVELCRSLGHEVQGQLAASPSAALVLATANCRQLEAVPLTAARLPGTVKKRFTGKIDKNLEKLHNMGINHLGGLLALPEREVARRLGPTLVDYLGRLTGRLPDPRECIVPAPDFDESLHLLEPIKDKDAVIFPMQRLLGTLEAWLVTHQLGAERLLWTFSTHAREDRVALPVTFARAQQQKRAFLDIMRLKLEPVELPEEILNVRLQAQRLTPWLGGSRSLFRLLDNTAAGGIETSESSELLDQLRARLGEQACSRIVIEDQHTPEAAWRPAKPADRPAGVAAGAQATHRPLWLFDPPHPTNAERLEVLKGPERIQSAWWQQAIWRDYYVVSLENGARCWAFQDARNQWYLHGYFG
ncbi:MAG: DNA polymerase Y family protein [Pseudomonadota bacterium]